MQAHMQAHMQAPMQQRTPRDAPTIRPVRQNVRWRRPPSSLTRQGMEVVMDEQAPSRRTV